MLSPVKHLRQKHGMSQQKLACLARISQGHVSDIERGFAQLDQSVLKVFGDAGEDIGKLEEKHAKFMRATQRELKSDLKQGDLTSKG